MKKTLVRSVAALLAGLALAATGAQALTIAPHASSLLVAPGSTATAEFDIDFGGDPLSFAGLGLELGFDVGQLAADAQTVTLSFAGTEPAFSTGSWVRSNHGTGAIISWSYTGPGALPELSGLAVLSVPFARLAGDGLASLTTQLTVYDGNFDEHFAAAAVDVVTTASSVPEPQSALLLLAGGCLLIGLRRRAS